MAEACNCRYLAQLSRLLINAAPLMCDEHDDFRRSRVVQTVEALNALITLKRFACGCATVSPYPLYYDRCARFFRVTSQCYPESEDMKLMRLAAEAQSHYQSMVHLIDEIEKLQNRQKENRPPEHVPQKGESKSS
nr:hypothetical protein [bacterium]